MDLKSYDFNRDNVYVTLKKLGYTHLSYSQISMYQSCQYKWKKVYIDRLKETSVSIDLLFGTAMHFVIQEWLTCMYTVSAKAANEMDLNALLKVTMADEYKKGLAAGKGHFSNATQMREYLFHGSQIIEELHKKRSEYFPIKDHELVGIEVPLVVDVDPIRKIAFTAFLDVVLKNTRTDEIIIIDLKTSRNGWNAKKKADSKSMAQLLFYKKYYAEQHNILLEKISILYLVLKRVLYTQSEFPQKRFQRVVPASGKPSINKAIKVIDTLINHGYKEDGSYNGDAKYTKCKDKTICQYCHLYKTDNCNWKED